jgi:hypothetical protein
MLNRGFISLKHRAMVLVETDLTALLERFEEYRPSKTPQMDRPLGDLQPDARWRRNSGQLSIADG